ncbi:hypothetical protein [Inhella proteolytica]|uniref:Uncharacterized protein n=1 Tax=Inhella proteolytica TaxID=2795029 RepID=A0A931J130_9BURK|nr:hypothetical protein [Inhella proteolytica]MBH9576190.1 hypothetical protein [Inhella proteolytica]
MTEPIEHPPPASAFERALLRSIASEAGPRGWQLLDGMPYWNQGLLFCLLIPFADARQGHARVTLSLKWRALDRVLWRRLGLSPPEGLRAHAASARALPGWTVYRSAVSGLGWPSEALERWAALAVQGAADCAARLQGELDALPRYLEFIEREHRALLERQPHASSRLEQERVLAALLLEDAAATGLGLARA